VIALKEGADAVRFCRGVIAVGFVKAKGPAEFEVLMVMLGELGCCEVVVVVPNDSVS
jgi:hypothetical protein